MTSIRLAYLNVMLMGSGFAKSESTTTVLMRDYRWTYGALQGWMMATEDSPSPNRCSGQVLLNRWISSGGRNFRLPRGVMSLTLKRIGYYHRMQSLKSSCT